MALSYSKTIPNSSPIFNGAYKVFEIIPESNSSFCIICVYNVTKFDI